MPVCYWFYISVASGPPQSEKAGKTAGQKDYGLLCSAGVDRHSPVYADSPDGSQLHQLLCGGGDVQL